MSGPRPVWLVVVYFGASFMLHFGWEMMQRPLFVLPPASFAEHVQMCLFATATGDMAFILTLYLTAAVIHQDIFWIGDATAYRHAATWVITALVGVLLAISFELWQSTPWTAGSMEPCPLFR